MSSDLDDTIQLDISAAPGKEITHGSLRRSGAFPSIDLAPPEVSQTQDSDAGVPIIDTVQTHTSSADLRAASEHSSSLAAASLSPRTCEAAPVPPMLSSFDVAGIAQYIEKKGITRIVCLCGAGISVSAGIPDFRSPDTGLYANLAKYDLPRPEAVFELDYFRRHPEPFYQLAKELYPGNFKPTPAHHFMKLLHDKGRLVRCYTQNIDSLETQAGLPAEKVIAAHGNFDSARCIRCKRKADLDKVKASVDAGKVHRCGLCNGLVKPDIVFFGGVQLLLPSGGMKTADVAKNLPAQFFKLKKSDLSNAELLIIMGTSLTVYPFASLIDDVSAGCPRLLINREVVGEIPEQMRALGHQNGLWFGHDNLRDAKHIGECDEGVMQLAQHLGWQDELKERSGPFESHAAQSLQAATRVADAVGDTMQHLQDEDDSNVPTHTSIGNTVPDAVVTDDQLHIADVPGSEHSASQPSGADALVEGLQQVRLTPHKSGE